MFTKFFIIIYFLAFTKCYAMNQPLDSKEVSKLSILSAQAIAQRLIENTQGGEFSWLNREKLPQELNALITKTIFLYEKNTISKDVIENIGKILGNAGIRFKASVDPHDLKGADKESSITESAIKLVRMLSKHKDNIDTAKIFNDYIVTTNHCGSKVKVWDLKTEKCINLIKPAWRYALIFIKKIVLSPNNELICVENGGEIVLWHTLTGQLITDFEVFDDDINLIAISPNNRFIVIALTNEAQIWDISSGTFLYLLSQKKEITSISISADNKLIVTQSDDKSTRIWDSATGQCIHVLENYEKLVPSLVKKSDKKFILFFVNLEPKSTY